jgi:hypothetical protein
MAKASMALAELVEKGAKDDVVRELLAHIVQRVISRSSSAAAPSKASGPKSAATATGIASGSGKTRAGAIDLRIPKLSPRELLSRISRASSNR